MIRSLNIRFGPNWQFSDLNDVEIVVTSWQPLISGNEGCWVED
jgi:hypothetical protein